MIKSPRPGNVASLKQHPHREAIGTDKPPLSRDRARVYQLVPGLCGFLYGRARRVKSTGSKRNTLVFGGSSSGAVTSLVLRNVNVSAAEVLGVGASWALVFAVVLGVAHLDIKLCSHRCLWISRVSATRI